MMFRRIHFVFIGFILGGIFYFLHSHFYKLSEESPSRQIKNQIAEDLAFNRQLASTQKHSQPNINLESSIDRRIGKIHELLQKNTSNQNQTNLNGLKMESGDSNFLDPKWKIFSELTFKKSTDANHRETALMSLSRFDLVKTDQASSLEKFNPLIPVVVFDQKRQQVGLVTGTLIIKYTDPEVIHQMHDFSEFEVTHVSTETTTIFLTPVKKTSLVKMMHSLRQSNGISSVELEILHDKYKVN